jgi:hypothetical protein
MTTMSTTPAAEPSPRQQARRAATPATVEELAARVAQLSTELGELRQAAQERSPEAETATPLYGTVEQWLNDYLLPTFPRPVGELGMQRWQWCERWWAHDEAVTRFMALWYGWEAARLEVTGMLGWLRELDYQLGIICGEDGPFRNCNLAHEDMPARHTLQQVPPAEAAPEHWWDWWAGGKSE